MRFERILASIDVSDDLATDVLTIARDFADRDEAVLDAVSVWPTPAPVTAAVGGEGAAGVAMTTQALFEQHKVGRENCETRLKEMVAQTAPNANVVILDGDTGKEVSEYAQKHNATLIVAGSHQRGFWGSLVHGSESQSVLHEAPCAVLLVTKTFIENRKKQEAV